MSNATVPTEACYQQARNPDVMHRDTSIIVSLVDEGPNIKRLVYLESGDVVTGKESGDPIHDTTRASQTWVELRR